MNKKYEVEVMRTNITPRQFWSYCNKRMVAKAGYGLEVWIDSYEDWMSPFQENDSIYKGHWDGKDTYEICRSKPCDFQYYLSDSYNFIMEFEFDDEKTGHGYMYAFEYESEVIR